MDIWWWKVFKSCTYSTLSLVVKACLSIFTRPHVEAYFSRMNDIIDKKSNCMDIETYSGIMNIKYCLETKTSAALYNRSDPLHDLVDENVLFYSYYLNKVQRESTRGKKFVKKKICQKELKYTAKSKVSTQIENFVTYLIFPMFSLNSIFLSSNFLFLLIHKG